MEKTLLHHGTRSYSNCNNHFDYNILPGEARTSCLRDISNSNVVDDGGSAPHDIRFDTCCNVPHGRHHGHQGGGFHITPS